MDVHAHLPMGKWLDGCPGCEWQRRYIDENFPPENEATAQADYAVLSAEQRLAVDLRWADVPEALKDELRSEAGLDLL